jgi:hypothetical protein
MPKISEIYAGQYVNATELPVGRRITAVITTATAQTVGQGDQASIKIVLDLRAVDGRVWPKSLVMNKLNSQMLAAVYGDDTEHWVNRHISIWREKVMFGGRLVDGIRMSAAAPAAGNGAAAAIPMPGPSQAPVSGAGQTPAQEAPPLAPPRRVVFDDGVPAYADAAPGPVGDDLDDRVPF